MAADTDASRAGAATAPRGSGRVRLGRRAWQEVRRGARTLGEAGTLYAAEIHGVKLYFRWAEAHRTPGEPSGGKANSKPSKAKAVRAADAQSSRPQPAKPQNSRQRRSATRLQEFMRHRFPEPHQQQVKTRARDDDTSCATECASVTRLRTGAAGNLAAKQPAAADGGSAQAAAPCGTARQQALAGSPAKAVLQSLPSDELSSEDSAAETDDISDMSDSDAAAKPSPRPRQPNWLEKLVLPGAQGPAARRGGGGPGIGHGKANAKRRKGGRPQRTR